MTAPIELDLDAIEAAAKSSSSWQWPRKEQFADAFNSSQMADLLATASPAIVLELIRRLRAAEALASSRIERIPVDTKVLAIFTELRPDLIAEAKEFAEAIQARCGPQTLVAFFQEGASVDTLDEEQMRKAGWVRAEQRDELLAALEFMVANIGQPHCLENREGFASAKAAIAKAKGGAV